ncbi:MAG TPA: hypothetical protein VFA59_09560 [Vicinamibacterales bacterium]|nr:hypothetical protein [Vicinamibacterales bacterium]
MTNTLISSARASRSSGALPFGAHVAVAAVVMVLAIWLSSGTLAPYAATLDTPLVLQPCQYLANVDHEHFRQTFLMLDGAPRSAWEHSVVLRRVLFPALSYPLMKWTTFELGGFLTSVLLHIVAFWYFARFLVNRFGVGAATWGVWLLATYPGITYWAALPYAYAFIVPGCLVSFVLLWRIAESDDARAIAGCAAILGVLALGYDLLPFFGLATVGLLVVRRRFTAAGVAALLLVLPTAFVNAVVLDRWLGVSAMNENSGVYVKVIHAYLTRPDWWQWMRLGLRFPLDAIRVYLFSNFLFLPLLFTAVWISQRRAAHGGFSLAEHSLLLAVVAVFLFNNVAPPYPGVQIRGSYIARLYQPAFVAFITYVIRSRAAFLRRAVVAVVVLNATIAFGAPVANPVASFVYLQFYGHGNKDVRNLSINVHKYGARPLGFCRQG